MLRPYEVAATGILSGPENECEAGSVTGTPLDPVRFRRSGRAKWVPVVVVVVVAVSIGVRPLLVPAAVVGFYLIMMAAINCAFRLEISADRIRMRGYLGGPRDIDKGSVNACRYHAYRVQQRSLELFFLEVLGLPGGSVKIWRYGWGRQRHALFSTLSVWLNEAGVALGDRERAFLAAGAAP